MPLRCTYCRCPSHAVDVDVNEFSHRLICTSWSAWRRSAPEEPCGFPELLVGQCRTLHALRIAPHSIAEPDRSPWLLKENRVTPRDGSTNAGDNARNSIQSGRRP